MQNFDPIKTDFTDLDKIIGGLYPGELVVIGAGPSIGKTSFLASLIRNITLKHEKKGLLFTLSKPVEAFRLYLISSISGISYFKIEYPEGLGKYEGLKKDEQEFLKMISFEVSNLQMFIDDTYEKNINDLCESARKMIRDVGVEIIYIDNINDLSTDDVYSSWSFVICEVITKLKQLAKELNVPIVGTTNACGVGYSHHPPSLSSLHPSIIDKADVILLLNRPRTEEALSYPASLNIAKNIYGDTGEIKITFFPETICFDNFDMTSENGL